MRPRAIAMALGFALLAGVAVAEPPKVTFKSTFVTHEVLAKVVSLDTKAKTITYLGSDGQTKTAPFFGKAIRQTRWVKVGGTYVLVCEDNAKGEHLGIHAIRVAPPAPASTGKPAEKAGGK
jgi:hypothetical protein